MEDIDETIVECSEAQWAEEMEARGIVFTLSNGYSFGGSLPCPNCKTIGFYGPRRNPPEGEIIRKYRACKFCGFWQEVWGSGYNDRGGKAFRCVALYCTTCDAYDWTLPKDVEDYKSCSTCHNQFKRIDWASDNPNHVFNEIKRQIILLSKPEKLAVGHRG